MKCHGEKAGQQWKYSKVSCFFIVNWITYLVWKSLWLFFKVEVFLSMRFDYMIKIDVSNSSRKAPVEQLCDVNQQKRLTLSMRFDHVTKILKNQPFGLRFLTRFFIQSTLVSSTVLKDPLLKGIRRWLFLITNVRVLCGVCELCNMIKIKGRFVAFLNNSDFYFQGKACHVKSNNDRFYNGFGFSWLKNGRCIPIKELTINILENHSTMPFVWFS